jgi:drug/metabolite transporter (DMT)-like permease
MNKRLTVAGLALGSVATFAAIGLYQQRLTAQFTVPTILALRVLLGSVFLAIYVRFRERFSVTVFWKEGFYIWTAFFLCTILCYGFAFAGQSLADVYLMATLMPIFAIGLEWCVLKKPFNWSWLPPIALMCGAAMLPNVVKIYNNPSLVNWYATGFAFLGAAFHASWVVTGRVVQQKVQAFAHQGNALLQMFLLGGGVLWAAANLDAVAVVDRAIRRRVFEPRFIEYATAAQWGDLAAAGLFSAVSVLLIAKAIKFASATAVAPYQYTLAIWGTLITIFLARPTPENTKAVLLLMLACSVVIALGALWLYKRQNSSNDSDNNTG